MSIDQSTNQHQQPLKDNTNGLFKNNDINNVNANIPINNGMLQSNSHYNQMQNMRFNQNLQNQSMNQDQSFLQKIYLNYIQPNLPSTEEIMLTKVFIGIGILDLPQGFSETGLIFSLFIYFLTSYVGIRAQEMIIEISFFEINKKRLQKAFDDKQDSDEEEEYNNQVRNLQPETNVSRLCSVIQIFGFEIGELICNLCIMTAQIGFCISYLIFIGRNCNLYICPDGSCDYYNHSIVISLLILIPLSFLKNLKDLTIVTQIGTVSIFSGLIIILISALFLSEDSYSQHSDTNPDEGFVQMNPMRLPYFLGIAAFQFEGVSVLLPIQKTMINKPKFKSIFSKTIWKLFVFTSIFAIVCQSSQGKNIDQIVMFNLPHSLLSTFTRMFQMIGIMLTQNIQLYPVLFSIQSADWQSKMEDNYVKYFIFVSINSSIICLTAQIAMYIPSFATFINLIGALSCGILIYILPPLAQILTMSQLNLGDKISQLQLSTIPILVFGFIICITGTQASSLEIIEKLKLK